jgi:nucleoside-diphosphate-sugar epimerase
MGTKSTIIPDHAGGEEMMTKVALSGADGQLGRFLRPRLLAQGVDLRSAGRQALQPLRPGEDLAHGDLRDPENGFCEALTF